MRAAAARAAIVRAVAVIWALSSTALPAFTSVAAAAETHRLGRPAYLVIEAARDSTVGFRWDHDAVAGRRHLRWFEGHLDIADTLQTVAFGTADLGVLLGPGSRGSGGNGELRFVEGVYRVAEMLELTDGRTTLHLSGGELDIRGDQIRYRRPQLKSARDPRAGYFMLAGMVLLVTVLLRRARRRR